MYTLALLKSVFISELGPMRHLALSELAYLIKKKKVRGEMDAHHCQPTCGIICPHRRP